tara:strand:- start:856 stop:1053 length:198 start_codon:yes stop_codon:yes gene_type:complete
MNESKEMNRYEELIRKANRTKTAVDIEDQKWLLVHPEMKQWADSHTEMVEWMTEEMKFPPRSDCG